MNTLDPRLEALDRRLEKLKFRVGLVALAHERQAWDRSSLVRSVHDEINAIRDTIRSLVLAPMPEPLPSAHDAAESAVRSPVRAVAGDE